MNLSENECFKIDTRGICLLCLTPPTSGLQTVTLPNNSNILKQLCRYIKVKPCELFGNSFGTSQSMEADSGHEVNVQITTCSLCSKLIEEFGRLYSSYVLIMVQMDDCVTSVAKLIKTANESAGETKHFLEQMKPRGFVDMINFTVASNLRSVALEKCVKKLKFYKLESQKQISERMSAGNQIKHEAKNSQDVKKAELVPQAPKKQLVPTNRQPASISSSSSADESDTEELTSKGDTDVEQEKQTDAMPLKFRERAAKTDAIVKVIQGNPQPKPAKTTPHRRTTKKANPTKKFTCVICYAELSSTFSLTRHYTLLHTRDKNIADEQDQLAEYSTDSLQSTNPEDETPEGVDKEPIDGNPIEPTSEVQNEQLDDGESGQSSPSSMDTSNSENIDTGNITEQVKDDEKASNGDPKLISKNSPRVAKDVRKSQVVKNIYGKGSAGLIRSKTTKMFNCTMCRKQLNTKLGFSLHMTKMHKEKYTFSRHKNLKKVAQRSSIVTLVETNSVSKQPANKCECKTCGKKLASKWGLQKHMRLHTKQPYMCVHCATRFTGLKQLNKHERDAHQNPEKNDKTAETSPTPENVPETGVPNNLENGERQPN